MRRPSLGTHHLCDCPVLGTWQSGLIVLHDGRPRAVGKSRIHHNLYLTSKLLEGEPLRVVSHKVDLGGRTLRWLVERLDTLHTYYVSGEMQVGSKLERVEDLDLYRRADLRWEGAQVHYARAAELAPYLGLVAAQGEVYVEVWLRAGDAAVVRGGGAGAGSRRY